MTRRRHQCRREDTGRTRSCSRGHACAHACMRVRVAGYRSDAFDLDDLVGNSLDVELHLAHGALRAAGGRAGWAGRAARWDRTGVCLAVAALDTHSRARRPALRLARRSHAVHLCPTPRGGAPRRKKKEPLRAGRRPLGCPTTVAHARARAHTPRRPRLAAESSYLGRRAPRAPFGRSIVRNLLLETPPRFFAGTVVFFEQRVRANAARCVPDYTAAPTLPGVPRHCRHSLLGCRHCFWCPTPLV